MNKAVIAISSVLIAAFFFVFNPSGLNTKESNSKDKEEVKEDMSNMKIFYMVLLSKGPNRNQSTQEANKIQKAHRANMTRLWEEGYLVMAGPMAAESNLQGIFIFDGRDTDFVDSLCKTDPAIAAGRLNYEIHPWFTEAGACLPEIE